MRTTRLLAGLLAGVTLPLLAAPAALAAPGGRDAAVSRVALTCSGDTVSGSALVRGAPGGTRVTVVLATRTARGGWVPTGRTATLTAPAGRSTVAWSLNTVGLAPTVTRYRAEVRAAGDTVRSRPLPVTACEPGQEIPEAPAALLVPATVALTGAGVLALRARAGRAPVAG